MQSWQDEFLQEHMAWLEPFRRNPHSINRMSLFGDKNSYHLLDVTSCYTAVRPFLLSYGIGLTCSPESIQCVRIHVPTVPSFMGFLTVRHQIKRWWALRKLHVNGNHINGKNYQPQNECPWMNKYTHKRMLSISSSDLYIRFWWNFHPHCFLIPFSNDCVQE